MEAPFWAFAAGEAELRELYRTGLDTGELIEHADCCNMCKRLIINAGIENVVIRRTQDTYDTISVRDWVYHDELLEGRIGY